MEQKNLESKERILRLSEVKARTGLSRSTLYLSISKSEFPPPINLGVRCVGWLESEIDTWIEQPARPPRKPNCNGSV